MFFSRICKCLFVLSSRTNAYYHKSSITSLRVSYVQKCKDKRIYKNNEFYPEKRKIITISPGGFRGFYMFGICKYIKENYKLDNYVFSGASAGAWLSLFMCFRGDVSALQKYLIDDDLQKTNSIYELENLMKDKILSKYDTNDFDLDKLYVGITTICNTAIFTDFENLEDALNGCIASSHIPIITGGISNIYRNIYTFDGGFSKYPYLNSSDPIIEITPFFGNKKFQSCKTNIETYTTLFSKNKWKFQDLIKDGYQTAVEEKPFFDDMLIGNGIQSFTARG